MGNLYSSLFSGWCFTTNNPWIDKGRIIVAWNPNMYTVDIRSCSSQFIHCSARATHMTGIFFITFVYGFNDGKLREKLWLDIQALAMKIKEAWIILGDYNEILHQNERAGKKTILKPSLSLRDCMTHCQMEDLKFSGCFYTWTNKQRPEDRIFDHSPILISFYLDVEIGKQPFMYFRMWKEAPSYAIKLCNLWKQPVSGTEMYKVVLKLKRLKQKAKATWVMNGDENTAIFHASLKVRRLQNRIYSIQSEQGNWVDTADGVQRAFLDYYQNLLGTQMPSRRKVSQAIVDLGPGISEEHSRLLSIPFTAQEVKEALFSISGLKAPGPDGYCSFFYQDNWELVGPEVCAVVLDFLTTGKLLKEINATTITLIPKTKCPAKVSDFRQISCCNVLYKIASKMICARLRRVLPDLIAENQGGFVHGRYIGHSIMICQDLVQHYGRKVSKPSCLLKVDLQKAYDTIEWDFIEEMLAAFNKKRNKARRSNVSITVCISGMAESEVNRIIVASGFARSQLPFRYLGIQSALREFHQWNVALF
ncbi:uncharacterized protein LOC133802068 [Humulus lupulus]|uniref:uncharacterized protein LOC133802068 n=1 Tax=Humulus lupulus TaxID=3486 RepID=UPI002B411251|nr:uncharacterized protein LOC133802068 [Humulus lupulus]